MSRPELYLINSIYSSTEGEGVHIGIPQIFIRYQGCSIGCVNCDSKDTWEFDLQATQTKDEVLRQVEELSQANSPALKRVSITGGDPLHPKFQTGLLSLARSLKERGHYINIEAAGTRIDHQLFDLVDYISFDYKTPSTRVKTRPELIIEMNSQFPEKFQVKSVIADVEDFEYVKMAKDECDKQLKAPRSFPWILTPVYNTGEDLSLDNFISTQGLNMKYGSPFRVIGQQHKWIYGPSAKNV